MESFLLLKTSFGRTKDRKLRILTISYYAICVRNGWNQLNCNAKKWMDGKHHGFPLFIQCVFVRFGFCSIYRLSLNYCSYGKCNRINCIKMENCWQALESVWVLRKSLVNHFVIILRIETIKNHSSLLHIRGKIAAIPRIPANGSSLEMLCTCTQTEMLYKIETKPPPYRYLCSFIVFEFPHTMQKYWYFFSFFGSVILRDIIFYPSLLMVFVFLPLLLLMLNIPLLNIYYYDYYYSCWI